MFIVEALSVEFVQRFWKLILDGGYGERNLGIVIIAVSNSILLVRCAVPMQRPLSFFLDVELLPYTFSSLHIL